MIFLPLFLLLRNMADSSAGSMFSSATGIFLSFLHAKVGRERLVYFIVRDCSVLILYFKKMTKIYVGLHFKSLLSTSFTFKDIDNIFCWLFVLSGTAFATSSLMSLPLDSKKRVWFPSIYIGERESWNSYADYVSFPQKEPEDKYRRRRGLLRDNCFVRFHHVT